MLHKPDWNPDILNEIGLTGKEVLELGGLLDDKTVWFFLNVHAKNLVWQQRSDWVLPEYKGRGKKLEKPTPTIEPVPVSCIATDDSLPWARSCLWTAKTRIKTDTLQVLSLQLCLRYSCLIQICICTTVKSF